MNDYRVKKLDGSFEPLNLTKAEASLEWATQGSTEVSIQDIMIKSKLHLFNGIETSFIHDIFIKTTYDLADVSKVGQQYWIICRNLMLQKLYKQVYRSTVPTNLQTFVKKNVDENYYTSRLLNYSNEDFSALEKAIDHKRDFSFTASGIEAMLNQYTILSDDIPVETPQMLYMAIAMDVSSLVYGYNLSKVIEIYNALSMFKVTLPTPEMLALRTGSLDIASCETLRVGDFITSWTSGDTAIVEDTVQSKGLGMHIGDISSVGDKVKQGKIIHSGKIPILRSFEGLINKSSQNNRRGSLTAFVNFFDPEIIDILSLKSIKTAADKRINSLSYGICLHEIVYKRAKLGQDITLISSRDVDTKSVSEALASNNFDEIYTNWEQQCPDNERISARFLLETIAGERHDNSAYYIINIDEINKQTMYSEPIVQSNICVEFTVPTLPLNKTKPDEPAVGICVLSNINQGVVDIEELPTITALLVDMQTKLSALQTHATPQANAFVKHYRDIGIGFSNHAYWLADKGLRYGQEKALEEHNAWMEAFTFGLLNASCYLAQEIGAAPGFNIESTMNWIRSLPISYNHNWNGLIKHIGMYGLANCGLAMLPPSESSSIPSNQTSAMEPVRDLLTIKDKAGVSIKQFVPECLRLADKYDFAYDRVIARDYIKNVAVTQKWMDKAMSVSVSYNPKLYINEKVPMRVVINDIYFAKSKGVKTMYYHNVKVEGKEQEKSGCSNGSCDV